MSPVIDDDASADETGDDGGVALDLSPRTGGRKGDVEVAPEDLNMPGRPAGS